MERPTARPFVILALLALVLSPTASLRGDARDAAKKPSVALRAVPAVSFAPARIVVTGDVRGGADDYEDFYCPAIEWDWGDGTRSGNATDCAPYEPGTSKIRRRYAVEHIYRQPGNFRIHLRLRKGSRIIGAAHAAITVRPGLPWR